MTLSQYLSQMPTEETEATERCRTQQIDCSLGTAGRSAQPAGAIQYDVPITRAPTSTDPCTSKALSGCLPLMYLHRPLTVPATSTLLRRRPHSAVHAKEGLERQQAGSCPCGCRWARPVSASLTDADCQKPSNALEDDLSTIEDDDSPGWRCSIVVDLQICSMLWPCLNCCCRQPGQYQGQEQPAGSLT